MYKSTCVVVVEVVYPLKQGLKLMKNLILEYYIEGVEVVYPLKQGLKHSIFKCCFIQISNMLK